MCSDVIATEEETIRRCLFEAEKVVSGSAIPKKPADARDEERTGPDHRNGQDLSPEQLKAEFGLRAIQFGNSVPKAERTLWVNETYMALALGTELVGYRGLSPTTKLILTHKGSKFIKLFWAAHICQGNMANGHSLETVQLLLGHAELDHVRPYLQVSQEELRTMFSDVF